MIVNNSLTEETYFYDAQIRQYIIQAMAVFAELKVMVGASETKEPRLINVPIHYGAKDRITASIKADNTKNKPIRVPCASVYMSSLNLAPELRKGLGQTRRNTYLASGGVFPTDIKVAYQTMPVVYRSTIELSLFVSSTDQHFQILEQILSIFNPSIQLQTSDEVLDWTKITMMELTGINFDQQYPTGSERRIITSSLTFEMPVYIGVPSNIRDNFIKSVMIRIGQMGPGHIGAVGLSTSEEDMIAELNNQNLEATKIFDLDDIQLNN